MSSLLSLSYSYLQASPITVNRLTGKTAEFWGGFWFQVWRRSGIMVWCKRVLRPACPKDLTSYQDEDLQCEHLILQIASTWDTWPHIRKTTKQTPHVPCQWHCELTVRVCMDKCLWRIHLWARGREGVAFKAQWQSRSIATLVHLGRSAIRGCSFTLGWLHMAELITLNRSGGALGVFLLLWQTSTARCSHT